VFVLVWWYAPTLGAAVVLELVPSSAAQSVRERELLSEAPRKTPVLAPRSAEQQEQSQGLLLAMCVIALRPQARSRTNSCAASRRS
jgi:hypothetical protein